MTNSSLRRLALGFAALLAACSGGAADMNALCVRQRDNYQRCNPTQSACERQTDYNDCVAAQTLYRSELTTVYLKCYPATLGCDSAADSAAKTCSQTEAAQIPATAALMTLAGSICQRCPSAAKEQGTDAATCMTALTTNATDLARALHFYTDETLGRLNTCLVGASPPADGCVALGSCFQNVVPRSTAGSCTDGGT